MKDSTRTFLSDTLGVYKSDLTDQTTLGQLDVDSLDLIDLACAFEDRHPHIRVDERRFTYNTTVREAGEYLESLI